MLQWLHHSKIWQASQQRRCRVACKVFRHRDFTRSCGKTSYHLMNRCPEISSIVPNVYLRVKSFEHKQNGNMQLYWWPCSDCGCIQDGIWNINWLWVLVDTWTNPDGLGASWSINHSYAIRFNGSAVLGNCILGWRVHSRCQVAVTETWIRTVGLSSLKYIAVMHKLKYCACTSNTLLYGVTRFWFSKFSIFRGN